jgi:hypothetical protein
VLAERKNAGIQVTLLWAEDTNAISVLVRDDGTDDQFELSVEPAADALNTFEHPYACAAWRASTIDSPTPETRRDLRRSVARVQRRAGNRCKTSRSHTRTRMNARADSLLTVRWRDRSFVLRAPEQVEELARRLRQKGLANIAVSISGAVVEGKTGSGKVLSDEEREAVCAVLTDAESDPALRRAFTLLCAGPHSLEAT